MINQANAKIIALKSEYKNLESVDREKIDKLKRQYLDHKKLWETVSESCFVKIIALLRHESNLFLFDFLKERLILVNTKDMEFSWDQVEQFSFSICVFSKQITNCELKEKENYFNKAEIAYGLQQEAQNLAEAAIRELEDFISDDARLVTKKFQIHSHLYFKLISTSK